MRPLLPNLTTASKSHIMSKCSSFQSAQEVTHERGPAWRASANYADQRGTYGCRYVAVRAAYAEPGGRGARIAAPWLERRGLRGLGWRDEIRRLRRHWRGNGESPKKRQGRGGQQRQPDHAQRSGLSKTLML